MSLLNKSSLAVTIDKVNDALFFGKTISKKEASDIIEWISTRLDTDYSYNKSFGITAKDMRSKVYTFTGERLSSVVSMRHIIAEEACRVLIQLSEITGKKVIALESSNAEFMKSLRRSESDGKPIGTYCCGPCTVGLWRHLAVGGLPEYSKNLPEGIKVLHDYHDGAGRWGRFPFFYTLLALSEIDHPFARKEIVYAQPECERVLNHIRKDNTFSKRKRELLLRVLN
jgi:hypothetical protein